mgnify:CR=1 FL=1
MSRNLYDHYNTYTLDKDNLGDLLVLVFAIFNEADYLTVKLIFHKTLNSF